MSDNLEDLLTQLVENCEPDLRDLKKMLVLVNDEIFNGELPIERITIRILPNKVERRGAAVRPFRKSRKWFYRMTFYRSRLEHGDWQENASNLEHECLHIWLHERVEEKINWSPLDEAGITTIPTGWRNNDEDFIYWAGRLNIQLKCKLF